MLVCVFVAVCLIGNREDPGSPPSKSIDTPSPEGGDGVGVVVSERGNPRPSSPAVHDLSGGGGLS